MNLHIPRKQRLCCHTHVCVLMVYFPRERVTNVLCYYHSSIISCGGSLVLLRQVRCPRYSQNLGTENVYLRTSYPILFKLFFYVLFPDQLIQRVTYTENTYNNIWLINTSDKQNNTTLEYNLQTGWNCKNIIST
jgi:hypothetical protein